MDAGISTRRTERHHLRPCNINCGFLKFTLDSAKGFFVWWLLLLPTMKIGPVVGNGKSILHPPIVSIVSGQTPGLTRGLTPKNQHLKNYLIKGYVGTEQRSDPVSDPKRGVEKIGWVFRAYYEPVVRLIDGKKEARI